MPVAMERVKVKLEKGGETSLVYGVPTTVSDDPACLIVAHGAGAPMYSPFISHFHSELAKRGFLTAKFNFPYTEARKKVPDKRQVLEDSYRRIIEEVRSSKYGPRNLFVGGKSMGGRIGSQVVADGVDVDGLFFLGYPLHPPGRLERMRDEHLYRISKPMLFVSGTKDAFATKNLLENVISKIGPQARIYWVEDGDHSFNTGEGKTALSKTYSKVLEVLVDWVNTCLSK